MLPTNPAVHANQTFAQSFKQKFNQALESKITKKACEIIAVVGAIVGFVLVGLGVAFLAAPFFISALSISIVVVAAAIIGAVNSSRNKANVLQQQQAAARQLQQQLQQQQAAALQNARQLQAALAASQAIVAEEALKAALRNQIKDLNAKIEAKETEYFACSEECGRVLNQMRSLQRDTDEYKNTENDLEAKKEIAKKVYSEMREMKNELAKFKANLK